MKGDHMGTGPTNPNPPELPLSNQTRFNRKASETSSLAPNCPNSGGSNGEAPRAILHADYLPAMREGRQDRLGRKPTPLDWQRLPLCPEVALFRLPHWTRHRQSQQSDGVL